MATRERVSRDDFIRAVFAAESFSEVAEATGLKLPSVTARYNQYKAKGINLKPMVRKANKLDVAAANALIAELANEASE